jgi:SAM-dependent methyltransferase
MTSQFKLDLGCGKNKKEGFIGVDSKEFPGVDLVHDLTKPWPWPDNCVDAVHCSHFVEHLKAEERILFVNELYRVLKPKAQAAIICPHWASTRAYGDLTHQWPPVCEMWFHYLSKTWRDENAPHNDFYLCDFETTYGYGLNPTILTRSQEYQQFAVAFYKESVQDIHATLTKK